MKEGFVIDIKIALLIGIPFLIGIFFGQLSVWRWLNKRYGVSKKEPFHEWLDRQLEKGEYFRKGWENFNEALDSVGREPE